MEGEEKPLTDLAQGTFGFLVDGANVKLGHSNKSGSVEIGI